MIVIMIITTQYLISIFLLKILCIYNYDANVSHIHLVEIC